MAEKDQDLTTIFICFLKAGFRFTRNDTNIVGLRFAEELRKNNPDFKPVKIEQREFKNHFIVNGYPKAFEPVIMELVMEYGKEHHLPYRMKKNRRPGGGFQRKPGSGRGYSANSPRPSGGNSFYNGQRERRSGDRHFGNRDGNKYPESDRFNRQRPRRRRIFKPGDENSGPAGPGNIK